MKQKSAEEKTSSALIALLRSYRFLLIIVIHVDPPDERAPIGQYGANATWNILRGKPDVVFIDHGGGSVVAPASASSTTEGSITAEAIIRSHAGRGDAHRTSSPVADAGKGAAGEEIVARERTRDDATPILSHRDRRIEDVFALHADIPLAADFSMQSIVAEVGTNRKPGDASLAVGLKSGNAIRTLAHRGSQRRPELTIDEHHLHHALVIGGNLFFRIAHRGTQRSGPGLLFGIVGHTEGLAGDDHMTERELWSV